jgi:hypothetical protein
VLQLPTASLTVRARYETDSLAVASALAQAQQIGDHLTSPTFSEPPNLNSSVFESLRAVVSSLQKLVQFADVFARVGIAHQL